MPTPIDCLGIGAPIIDLLARVPEDFIPHSGGAKGGMEMVDDAAMDRLVARLPEPPALAPGGSASNTIVTLARLGTRAGFLGMAGGDDAAGEFRRALAARGVDATRLKQAAQPNARCLSLITPDGQRTMRTYLGASAMLEPAVVSPADFQGCRHAHFEGYLLFNRALLLHLVRCARDAGCSVSIDLASFEVVRAAADLLPSLLRDHATLVIANQDEAAAFFPGLPLQDCARRLAELCPVAVILAGRDGAWIARGPELMHAPARVVPNPLDTTGAGDSWIAGFLHGWLQNKPLPVCGAYGAVLGAAVVQTLGAHIPDAGWSAVRSAVAAAG